MAGYVGWSKSFNAVAAEYEGRFPLSIISRSLGIPAKLIREFVSPCEWHHTSRYFNMTDYYDELEVMAKFGLVVTKEFTVSGVAIAALASFRPRKFWTLKELWDRHVEPYRNAIFPNGHPEPDPYWAWECLSNERKEG